MTMSVGIRAQITAFVLVATMLVLNHFFHFTELGWIQVGEGMILSVLLVIVVQLSDIIAALRSRQ